MVAAGVMKETRVEQRDWSKWFRPHHQLSDELLNE